MRFRRPLIVIGVLGLVAALLLLSEGIYERHDLFQDFGFDGLSRSEPSEPLDQFTGEYVPLDPSLDNESVLGGSTLGVILTLVIDGDKIVEKKVRVATVPNIRLERGVGTVEVGEILVVGQRVIGDGPPQMVSTLIPDPYINVVEGKGMIEVPTRTVSTTLPLTPPFDNLLIKVGPSAKYVGLPLRQTIESFCLQPHGPFGRRWCRQNFQQ